jgi:hypothetical protein
MNSGHGVKLESACSYSAGDTYPSDECRRRCLIDRRTEEPVSLTASLVRPQAGKIIRVRRSQHSSISIGWGIVR